MHIPDFKQTSTKSGSRVPEERGLGMGEGHYSGKARIIVCPVRTRMAKAKPVLKLMYVRFTLLLFIHVCTSKRFSRVDPEFRGKKKGGGGIIPEKSRTRPPPPPCQECLYFNCLNLHFFPFLCIDGKISQLKPIYHCIRENRCYYETVMSIEKI